MAERNFFTELYEGIADAVTDIRQKVVEEPWYGRAVTEGREGEAPQWPQAREAEPDRSAEQERDQADRDIDR